MAYTIHFFAMKADVIGERFRREPEAVADEVVAKIADDGQPTEQDLVNSRQFAQTVCTGNFSPEDAADEINTLCWMCELAGEKIDIPNFNFFRSVSFLEDIGIWPLFEEEKPPFPVPECTDGIPAVGYLSFASIKRHTESEFGELPECQDSQSEDARDDLLGIMETLVEDKLDLLAILVEA